MKFVKEAMNSLPGKKNGLQYVRTLLSVVLTAYAGFASAAPADRADNLSMQGGLREYSVINLSPIEAESAVLNRRGQAAFANNTDQVNGVTFFDGQRLHRVGPFEHPIGYKQVWGLNNLGTVIAEADSDLGFPDGYRAYTWSLPGTVRSLTNGVSAVAHAINDRNQIVGFVAGSGGGVRAHRWNVDGTGINLGPAPAGSFSEAFAINDRGVAAGYSDNRAMMWDANGKGIDLGLPSGPGTIARFVNAQDQVAGTFQVQGMMGGFVWSRSTNLARIGPFPGLVRIMGFNDSGQVAGNRQVSQEGLIVTFAPFTWTAKRGMQLLPLGGGAHGRVDAMNNKAEMVGFIQRVGFDDTSKRATYWNDVASSVDLNTRLYKAPRGLVLKAALAINESGTILANSNAGLVMLRPGRTGTAAPVLGPLISADSVELNGTLDFTVTFVDSNPRETHLASADVNDFCPQLVPSLREARGAGDVSLRHTFCRAGVFNVNITIADLAGNATRTMRQVYVSDAVVRP